MNTGEARGQTPVLNIVGDMVALGPIRRDLLPLYQRWVNDFEVTRMLDLGLRPITLEAEEDWYENACRNRSKAHFTVYELETMRPVGNAGLMGINHLSRTAELGIFLGDKDYWGKGYGTETIRLVLDYGFTALGLHNIMLRVHGDNQRAIRAYLNAGFKLIGRRRQAVRSGGHVLDEVLMDCLATEFDSPVLARLLGPPSEV
ncbi:MAG: GNAT family N-acetyltransferase [Chloroflexi bacterium]|nr:GNAT family N-acetyltransferase [Chloroflexota bacterium]